jgi:hypothetical protein
MFCFNVYLLIWYFQIFFSRKIVSCSKIWQTLKYIYFHKRLPCSCSHCFDFHFVTL